MDAVVRSAAIYVVVWLIFRLVGRRTMAQITTFDFVLLLICGEATQQALLGEDFTITNAAVCVLTLVMMDDLLTSLRARFPAFERITEGLPLLVVQRGIPVERAMRRERIDTGDVLHAARESQGLSRMDQIESAVLESSGGISVIPKQSSGN